MSDAFTKAEEILGKVDKDGGLGISGPNGERTRWLVDKYLELGKARADTRASGGLVMRTPVTVDPKAIADEIRRQLAAIPRAKARKLKARRAEPARQVTHVPGWGTIDVYQAAGEMQKLVRDIGEVRQQRDSMREERNEALRANVELLAERDQSAVAFGNLQRDLAALRHALNDSNDDRHRMRQLLDDGRLAVDKAHQAVKTVLEGDQ